MEEEYTMDYHFRQFTITEHALNSIAGYVRHGWQPGSFLTAVICNNLKQAVMCADDNNLSNLPAYVEFFYNHTPVGCWGSEEKMRNWIQKCRKERGEI